MSEIKKLIAFAECEVSEEVNDLATQAELELSEILAVIREARRQYIPIYKVGWRSLGKASVEFITRLDKIIKKLEAK